MSFTNIEIGIALNLLHLSSACGKTKCVETLAKKQHGVTQHICFGSLNAKVMK
jgi:hypothetical protein